LASVIRVQDLSKRYRLGLKEKKSDTLIGQIGQALRSPWENLQKLRNLSRFGEEDESVFWALKDVSFEVKAGEVLGIIGNNGAGKSTLLKILSQITEPTAGRIEIHGRVASLLEVGTGFHPELSGRENIYMNGTILGMTRKEIDRKLDEIIDFSGVEKFIDTPVKFYSSGMKVRLGFSVAAHLDPEILIIDEVLAVGDAEFQKKCLGKMEDVSKNQGRTVLFVSHHMDSVRKLCSRAVLLGNGRVSSIGAVEEIVSKYIGSNQLMYFRDFTDGKIYSHISDVSINREALKYGELELLISFRSKEIIENPIIGFVLYNQLDVPVFGSNPRFHSGDYTSRRTKSGSVLACLNNLNLHSGIYKLSFWLSDGYIQLDVVEEALVFEYISTKVYYDLPNPLFIGSIDVPVNWKFLNNNS
jgi:lipopolysaccharide transport system ATP-binding protein